MCLPENENLSKPVLRRITTYRDLLRERSRPREELAQTVGACQKTVQRDFRFLIEEWSWPLRFSEKDGCWRADGPMPLPTLTLSEEEATALLMAEPALRAYGSGPLATGIHSAVSKIVDCLDAPLPLSRPEAEFAIHNVRQVDPNLFKEISAACGRHERLEIRYFNPERQDVHERLFDPYHLENWDGGWQLVGYCHWRKRMIDLAISQQRMLNVRHTGEIFVPDKGLLAGHADGFGVFRSGDRAVVELIFAISQAVYQQERVAWRGEEREVLPDGRLRVTFPAPINIGLKRWLMQFGSEVEVIRPTEMREWMQAEAQRVLEGYRVAVVRDR